MSELKPCPKCKEAKPWVNESQNLNTKRFYIYCKMCGYREGICLTEEQARKIWNKRPIEDELRTEIKELREDVDLGLRLHGEAIEKLIQTRNKLEKAINWIRESDGYILRDGTPLEAPMEFFEGGEIKTEPKLPSIENELRAEKEKFRRMWIDDTVTLQDKLEKTKEATKQFIKNAREGQYESMINSYSMPANDLVDFERALKDIEETTNV